GIRSALAIDDRWRYDVGAWTDQTQCDEDVTQIALHSCQIIDDALGDDEAATWKGRQRRDPRLDYRVVKGMEILGGLGDHEQECIDGGVNNFCRCWIHAMTLLDYADSLDRLCRSPVPCREPYASEGIPDPLDPVHGARASPANRP